MLKPTSMTIHTFASHGYLYEVKRLIENGTDVDLCEIYTECTSLHYAAGGGHLPIVDYLINLKANKDKVDFRGWTALHYAAYDCQLHIVEYLLNQNANKDIVDHMGWTALHYAAEAGHLPIVEYLLNQKANKDTVNHRGSTPLHVAFTKRRMDVVKCLVDHNADISADSINAEDHNKETLLHIAAAEGDPGIVEYFISHGASIDAKDHKGSTPVHVACTNNKKDVIECLVDRNADINAEDNNKTTPLHRAAASSDPDIINYLISHGAKIEAKDNKGWTSVHYACDGYKKTNLECLIDHKANIETKENDGKTPLHVAASNSYSDCPDIVKHLISHGANIEATDDQGSTPVHVACTNNKKEVLKCLVDRNADINAEDNIKNTPLHRAAANRDPDIIHYLISHGAKIEAKDNNGSTSLHIACENSRQHVVECLVDHNADIEAEDNGKKTPLHIATFRCGPVIVNYLIGHGANTEAKDNKKETPYGIAMRLKDKTITRIFKRELGKGLPREIRYLHVEDADSFKKALRSGFYYSHVGKIMVVGNEGVGKTAITAILIGKMPSKTRKATEGIDVHISRTAVDLENRKLIPKDLSFEDVAYGNLIMRKRYGGTSEFNVDDVLVDDDDDDDEKDVFRYPEEETEQPDIETSPVSNNPTAAGQPSTEEEPSFLRKTLKKLGIGREERETITVDMLKEGTVKAGKRGLHMMHLAPVIIFDFAGQRVFYSTHQSFLTHRGIYVLTINGSLQLDDEMGTESPIPGKYGKKTTKAYIRFWVSSILTYSRGRNKMFPKIMILCTHKDRVPVARIDQQRSYIYGEITSMFEGTPAMDHLVLKHQIFVNAMDPRDPEIEVLKDALVYMMFIQPSWGEKIPKSWIHLEMMINKKVASGETVLHRTQLEEMNRCNPVQVLSGKDLDIFLKVHHSQGDIIYFPLPGLKDHIIIYPAYLVDALKFIVTDKRFCTGRRREMLNTMNTDGVLKKADIGKIWETNRKFLQHQGYITSLMSHLDILTEPRQYDQDTGTLLPTEFFFVPSLVTKEDSSDFGMRADLFKKCLGLSFKFHSAVLPSAVSFRFISCCIDMWDVYTYQNQRMLFSGMVVVVINKSLTMLVQAKEQRVDIFLIHETSRFQIIPDIASRIRECLNDTLYRISDSYKLSSAGPKCGVDSVPFHIEYPCFHIESPCYAEQRDASVCSGHEYQLEEAMKKWFVDRTKEECPLDCPGVTPGALEETPTELQLAKLVLELSWIDHLRPILLHLGMTENEIKNIEADYNNYTLNIMFISLRKWKIKTQNGNLKDVYNAIKASGSNVHALCKVFRDKPLDLPLDVLERKATDQDLDKLAPHVIDESLLLSVLLGIDASYWLRKKMDCHKIVDINRKVLRKWRDEHPGKPKMRELAQALSNVGINIDVFL